MFKMNGKQIAYIYSEELIRACNQIPPIVDRASIVHDLVESYNLLKHPNLAVVLSQNATEDELKLFHSSAFVECMKQIGNEDELSDEQIEFGLGYDCPILPNHFEFIKTIAGGSLTAAKLLAKHKCRIAINWCGGWHHAQRDSVAGFCYVNDIVLAIQTLKSAFKKVLYLDLDVHHGDGVQNAFELSKSVLTLSFHKYSPGFYPGSGGLDDVGMTWGKYHAINVPILAGCKNETFSALFEHVFEIVTQKFRAEAVVLQCGADSLAGDKLGESNFDLRTIGQCVVKVLAMNVPVLFLGGGGYNLPNTARLWAYLTSIICGETLDDDIPDSSKFFTQYAPTYELHIESKTSMQKDLNSKEYVGKVIETIRKYSEFIQS